MQSKFLKGIALAALLVQLGAPLFASAESGKTDVRPQAGAFCARLETFESKVDQNIYGRETKLHAGREEASMKREAKWNTRDVKLAATRGARDENVSAHFDKISARATTDAQKQALATFKAAYTQALADRKVAVDNAIKTYRDGVSSAASTHQNSVDGLIATFKAAIQAAEDKAKSDCNSGVDAKTIRDTFTASVQSARAAFESARADLENRGDILAPLITARNAALKSAADAFKTAMDSAKAALRLAFPQNS